MKELIKHIGSNDLKGIGGKAANLLELNNIGVQVPKWAVIPENVLIDQLNISGNEAHGFEELSVPKELIAQLRTYFGNNVEQASYAVRSSAIDEDGSEHSFAGQFETQLYVPFTEIEKAIIKIWNSVRSDRIRKYREENNLAIHFGIAVIIQEMVDAEISGVGFGMDPLSGDADKKVISAVYGLGEGIVSGDLDADTYILADEDIKEQIVVKSQMVSVSESGKETMTLEVPKEKQNSSCLDHDQLKEIEQVLNRLESHFHKPQDIEFSYSNGSLYLLQTRPITATGNQGKGEYIVWDNSNIIESYPGITTPLTFSFIIKMYKAVYRQLSNLMGVRESELDQHEEVFANTLGLVRGRVYYNLLSWYQMLAMLPGYSLNAEYMETMMGVKERFELKEDYRMNKGLARIRILGMVFRMFWLQMRLPAERKHFMRYLNGIMDEYGKMPFDSMKKEDIVKAYKRFERSLLLEWKAPMINDFFAMIWFGVLKKKSQALVSDSPNIHNDLLCGSQDIISVEPVHLSIEIAETIANDQDCKMLFMTESPADILKELNNGKYPEVRRLIDAYISKFGNRCIGELKLETISYSEEPSLFIKVISSYVKQGVKRSQINSGIEDDIRKEAEQKIALSLKGNFFKRWWFNYILRQARTHVSSRENLRYERTRGFGMVRVMFNALGKRLFEEGHLSDPRQIYYLELDEILKLDAQDFDPDLKKKIAERESQFETYRNEPDPEERFYTYGKNFTDDFIYSKEKLEPIVGDLKGIGCCPGRVKGKVRVVKDPREIESLHGDILVTSSTDPGWVTLFPTASAIIVERGSLLSHSAIVSREMGIPCVVGVTGLLRTVQTGDDVIMDGSTGEIKVVTV